MTQTGYSSEFQMGSGLCKFFSLGFLATPNAIAGVVRFM
jgi:hypothetical protein